MAAAFWYDDSVGDEFSADAAAATTADFRFDKPFVSISFSGDSSPVDDDKDCGCSLGDGGVLDDDVAVYVQFDLILIGVVVLWFVYV